MAQSHLRIAQASNSAERDSGRASLKHGLIILLNEEAHLSFFSLDDEQQGQTVAKKQMSRDASLCPPQYGTGRKCVSRSPGDEAKAIESRLSVRLLSVCIVARYRLGIGPSSPQVSPTAVSRWGAASPGGSSGLWQGSSTTSPGRVSDKTDLRRTPTAQGPAAQTDSRSSTAGEATILRFAIRRARALPHRRRQRGVCESNLNSRSRNRPALDQPFSSGAHSLLATRMSDESCET